MDNKKSASKSQKSATKNNDHLAEILTLEKKEAVRVQKELRAMKDKEAEWETKLQEDEEAALNHEKDTAKEALKAYKDSELKAELLETKDSMESEQKSIDSQYKKNKESAMKKLVDSIIDTTFFLSK